MTNNPIIFSSFIHSDLKEKMDRFHSIYKAMDQSTNGNIISFLMDDNGEIIDPYNGRDDLENRLLRHVSPAFSEDPLRVLRVARFAARYAHLGFRIAEETMTLMREMVEDGEVDHLVPERVWQELSQIGRAHV